jgi:hypothetical protein
MMEPVRPAREGKKSASLPLVVAHGSAAADFESLRLGGDIKLIDDEFVKYDVLGYTDVSHLNGLAHAEFLRRPPHRKVCSSHTLRSGRGGA